MNENYFPKNLKYLRRKKGLTQNEIRAQLGFTRSTWSNYENGVTNPSLDDLINFSNFFGISLEELVRHDLEEKDPLPVKPSKKKGSRHTVVYAVNDSISTVHEPDIAYVLRELQKLRDEVNTIKQQQDKQ